jgi:predicted DNA-binding WGR domain protein
MFSDCKNNNNKFYVCQCLKKDNGGFEIWTRYGRVGDSGVPGTAPLNSNSYESVYRSKVKSKTAKGYK